MRKWGIECDKQKELEKKAKKGGFKEQVWRGCVGLWLEVKSVTTGSIGYGFGPGEQDLWSGLL